MKKTMLLLCCFVSAAIPACAQDYAIRLHYPIKAGQRFSLSVVAQSVGQNAITAGQQLVKSDKEDLAIELESIATVLEVDAAGRATKESHVISKLLQGKPGAKKPVLPAGTKVIAYSKDRKSVFEVDGQPATGDVAKALELGIKITNGGPTDDEIFGSKERKKVGESWDINQESALKDLAEYPTSKILKVVKLSGKTTLQKVTKDGSMEVQHLTGTFNATMGAAPGGPLSTGAGSLQVNLTAAIPADPTKGVWEENATMTATIRASGSPSPSSPSVEMTGTMRRTHTSKHKLLN